MQRTGRPLRPEPQGLPSWFLVFGFWFQDADKRYNSGLFDFRKDTVRKTGTVPDCGRVRAAGDCPEFSEFSVIADTAHRSWSIVPGTEDRKPGTKNREPETNIVIRLTSGHRAKVEEKPEVRGAGGARACA